MAIRLTLSIFFSFIYLNAINLNTIDLKEAKKYSQLEVTTYANGKQNITFLNTKNPSYYTPTTSTLVFQKKPKSLQSNFGTIYLYDLSKQGQYLNVLNYDFMEIEGNMSNISIGLADKYYFKKEDHLKLPLKHHFNLQKLFGKIDLSRLKYLVIITASGTPPPIKKIIFKNNQEYTSLENNHLETWAWNPEYVTHSHLKKQPIERIYIQMKSGFQKALKRMKDTNITIYGLNGSPEDIFHYTHLLKDIDTLAILKKDFPSIQGYQVDIEPYLLNAYKKDPEKILNTYLTLIQKLKIYTKKHELKLSVVIPFWFDHLYVKDKNVGFRVIDIADEVVLMSYRSDINKVFDISKILLNYAHYSNKELRIGIELMKIENESHTVYKITQIQRTCLSSGKITDNCIFLDKMNQYTVYGKEISFYKQTEKLKYLLSHPIPFPSFQGFVLHHFDLLSTVPPLFYTDK